MKKVDEMKNDRKTFDQTVFGSFLSMVGTIEAAITNTPYVNLTDQKLNFYRLVGNTLQALGSAIVVDTEEIYSLRTIGGGLQSFGNSVDIFSILSEEQLGKRQAEILGGIGSFIQSCGSFLSLADDLEESEGSILNIMGNLLEGIGNALEGVGSVQEAKEDISLDVTETIGSWIQATGSVLSFISALQAFRIAHISPYAMGSDQSIRKEFYRDMLKEKALHP